MGGFEPNHLAVVLSHLNCRQALLVYFKIDLGRFRVIHSAPKLAIGPRKETRLNESGWVGKRNSTCEGFFCFLPRDDERGYIIYSCDGD